LLIVDAIFIALLVLIVHFMILEWKRFFQLGIIQEVDWRAISLEEKILWKSFAIRLVHGQLLSPDEVRHVKEWPKERDM